MKKIKLIFILSWDLSPRYISHFCIDELSEEFDVEYWDLSKISVPPTETSNPAIRPYVKHFNSLSKLKKEVALLPNDTLGVIYLDRSYKMYEVHKIISSKIHYGIFMYFNKSMQEDQQSRAEAQAKQKNEPKITPKLKRKSILQKVKSSVYSIEWIYLLFKFIRYRGDERFAALVNARKSRAIQEMYKGWIDINNREDCEYRTQHPDYDLVLSVGESTYKGEPYILYIDSYWPLHSMWIDRVPGLDFKTLAEPYYKSMNRFFDRLENEYGYKVKIAVHPAAAYENDPYGGRELIKYKSVELTRDCWAVCLHASNSANFIAYYDKPMAIITNDVLDSVGDDICYGSLAGLTQALADKLKLDVVNVDHCDKVSNIFRKLEPKVREDYVNKYLVDLSNPVPTSELLKKHFHSIYNRIYVEQQNK